MKTQNTISLNNISEVLKHNGIYDFLLNDSSLFLGICEEDSGMFPCRLSLSLGCTKIIQIVETYFDTKLEPLPKVKNN